MSLSDEPFRAECLRSDVSVEVAEGESLLHALLDAGIDVDFSCESGQCGTCSAALVSGDVDHRDDVLDDDERAEAMITCVSRARTLVRLDI